MGASGTSAMGGEEFGQGDNCANEVDLGNIRQRQTQTTLISTHEFDDFPSLVTKIIENRARTFVVGPPNKATPDDFQALLDLRSNGFKVEPK